MNISRNFIVVIICIMILFGCKVSKEMFVSYKVNYSYTTEKSKTVYSFSNLISYGDYLFEFRNRLNIVEEIRGEIKKNNEFYDTLGVYLMSTKNKLYYEFDKFSDIGKIVKKGNILDKQAGLKFNFKNIDSVTSNSLFMPPKEAIINNINCYTSDVVSTISKKQDSIVQKMILIKNAKFNSLFKINGVNFSDKNYCIVGFTYCNLKSNQIYAQEIESMRILTEKELKICEDLIAQSKL